ncbi:Putative serine/threonine-protein kinase drkA [Picochlorum sp. SENEW3]|nr:Putative serine/threonine-protein kinase drkA [Picochlorum sp. SENEW3]
MDTTGAERGGDGTSGGGGVSASSRKLIDECRAELGTLRALVKRTISHKEKSRKLLAQASELVVKLEDIMYSTSLSEQDRDHLIRKLATRVVVALDVAQNIVEAYGNMGSMQKLKTKLTSSADIQAKFDGSMGTMRTLMVQAEQGEIHMTKGESMFSSPPMSPHVLSGVQEPGVGQEPKRKSSDTILDNGQRQTSTSGLGLPHPSVGNLMSQEYSGSQYRMTDGVPRRSKTDGVTALDNVDFRTIWTGSRQEFFVAARSITFDTDSNEDAFNSTFLWMYCSKFLGSDKLRVLNLSYDLHQTVQLEKNASGVTSMHYDTRGVMWTGHRNGSVTAWNVHSQKPYCKPIKASNGMIKALTSDENGAAWVGSDKGDVRRVLLREQLTDAGEVLGYELVLAGALKHSGTGTPDISASHKVDSNGMVINLRAKEKAHNGPVFAICAASGRVWTSGGSPAFLCFREWTQRGEFMSKKDLKVTGAAVKMKIVSPFVLVKTPTTALTTALSGGTDTSTSSVEVPQQYQIVMGYANGTVGVWGPVNGVLCQILRIGRQAPPVTGLAIIDELGLLCTSHLDGKLRVRVPPRTVDRDRLSVIQAEKTVSAVNLNVVEISTSDSGESLVDVVGHPSGLSYINANGTVKFVSNDTLAEILTQSGNKLLRDMGNKLSECSPEWASKTPSMSDRPSEDDFTNAAMKSTSLFPQDAFQWMIDYSDLMKTRVIGEGAFGKVYLGKWHETDVAIKALTSLGALGIAAGQVASYATEADVKDALKTLEREVGLMVNMRHPNVILFMGVCPDPPCVVTEYCAMGSLYDVLIEAKENSAIANSLTWHRRVGMMMDAAKGMLYLHSHKPTIIHRDLKSPNLLVDGNWTVKVTDFNLSRLSDVATQPGVASSVVANNPRWHAPEIIRDALFSKSGDVYAFGLIMWEMISWALPFDGMSSFQMILFIGDKGGRPPIPSPGDQDQIRGGSFPGYEAYVELMQRCWDQNPEKRPLFPEIIARLREILSTFPDDGCYHAQMTDTSQEASSSVEEIPKEPSAHTTSARALPALSPFDMANGQTATAARPASSPFDAPSNPQQPISSPFDAPSSAQDSVRPDTRGSSGRQAVIDSVSETKTGKMNDTDEY